MYKRNQHLEGPSISLQSPLQLPRPGLGLTIYTALLNLMKTQVIILQFLLF